MSFLAPDKIPFSIVDPFLGEGKSNPDDLAEAITAEFNAGTAVSAPNASIFVDPTQTIVVGDGNTVFVGNSGGEASNVLLTGLGSTAFINGNVDVAGTNLGGGGLIVETVQFPEEDFGSKTIAFYSRFSGEAGDDYYSKNGLIGEDMPMSEAGTVDLQVSVGGNDTYSDTQTIEEAAGGQVPVPGFTFYGHGGAGDDLLVGSDYNDFLRGGAGDDQIGASGGDDLVRGGAGSDQICLGMGMDTVYYTSDQMNSTDTIDDFISGEDKITFDSSLNVNINGYGTNEITASSSAGTVTIVSEMDAIQESDIDFV